MMKKILISAAFSLAFVTGASAGDTVTITSPGGASQEIANSALIAALNNYLGSEGLGAVGSVTQVADGSYEITIGDSAFIVSSATVAMLLLYYS